MSIKKKKFIFISLILMFFSVSCKKKIDIKTEPKFVISENEKAATIFEDEDSYKASNFFLKRAIDDYLKEGHWERAIQNYIKLGNGFSRLKNFKSALKYLNMGLNLSMEHSGYKYSILAKSYHKIAFGFMKERKFEKAVEIYKKALKLKKSIYGKYHSEVSRTYNSLSLAYRNMGDSKNADKYYYKSLLIKLHHFEKIDDNFFKGFKFVNRISEKRKLYKEAKKVLNKSLKVYLETFGGYSNLTAVIFENIGIIYAMEGAFDRSLENFRNALRIRINLFGENSFEAADTLHDMGVVFSLRGNNREAKKYLQESLKIKISRVGEFHLFTADTYFQLGKICYLKGDIDHALKYFQNSLYAMNKKFSKCKYCSAQYGNFKKSEFTKDIINVLKYKAKSLVAKSEGGNKKFEILISAQKTYIFLVKIIEILKERFRRGENNSEFNKTAQKTIKDAIDISYRLFSISGENRYKKEAFSLSEKSKASLLLSMIHESEAKQSFGIPEKLLIREKFLQKKISDFQLYNAKKRYRNNRLSEGNKDPEELDYYKTQREYRVLLKKFEKDYKNYFMVKYEKKIVDPDLFRMRLNKNEAVIEYLLGANYIYTFFLSNDDFLFQRFEIPDDFKSLINTLYISIEKIEEDMFIDSSKELYRILIKPFLKNLSGKEKLVIIPHGKLFLLPFEVLIPDDVDFSSFSDLKYLVKRFSISYNYSLTIRDYIHSRKVENNGGFIGYAPVFDWAVSALPYLMKKELPKLPASDIELRRIIDLFRMKKLKAEGFFYEDATENSLKKNLSTKDYAFVHIATHTIINREKPNLSGLIFSTEEEKLGGDDGILFSGEIYNMKFKTNLLVLSSCESGVGKLMEGEGVLTLSRGFLYAGANNIIFSLLKVEDKSTGKLMINFYRNVLNGKGFAESLRSAKLKLVTDPYTAFPKYWGGFILLGE